MKKLARARSDFCFLSKCKQLDVIPQGLTIKNPLALTYNTPYSKQLCKEFSSKLRNHFISILYSKQQRLVSTIDILKNQLSVVPKYQEIRSVATRTYESRISSHFQTKARKLNRLTNLTIGNSSSQTTNGTEGTKVVNLSSHIQLYCDMENYFRRLRLKGFFNQNLSDPQNAADVDSFSTALPMQASNQIPTFGSVHVAGSSALPSTHATNQILALLSADIAGYGASP